MSEKRVIINEDISENEADENKDEKQDQHQQRVKDVMRQINPQEEKTDEPEFQFSDTIPVPQQDVANNIYLCAPTGAGKTNFALHLINNEWVIEDENNQKQSIFDMITVMSSTAGTKPNYSLVLGQDFLKEKSYLTTEFDEEFLANLMTDELVDSRKLVFIDDFGYSKKDVMKSEVLMRMITSGRHYNITLIINVQDYFMLPPDARNNVTWVAFWQLNKKERIDRVCSEFETVEFTDDNIREMYKESTGKKFGFLWIHMTQPRAFFDCLDSKFGKNNVE